MTTADTNWSVGPMPLRRTTSPNYTTWWLTGDKLGSTILCAHSVNTCAFFTAGWLPDGVYTRQPVNADSLDLHVAAFLVLHEKEILAAIAELEGSGP